MSTLIELSKDKRIEITDYLTQRFYELKSQRDNLDDKVLSDLRLYNSIKQVEGDDEEEWRRDYSVPYIFSIIKSIFPRLYFSIFGNNKWLKVTAETEAMVGNENKISAFLTRIADKIGFKEVVYEAIKRAMIYPNAIMKTVFDPRTNLPMVTNIDYFDYWQDISVKTIEKAPDCFNRVVMSRSDVLKRVNSGVYYDDINYKKTSFPTDIANKQATALNYFLGDNNLISVKDESSTEKNILQHYEVLEYYGYYDIDDDGLEEKVILTLINREVLARVVIDEEDERPFVKMEIDKEPVGFYGKSYIMMLRDLQVMLDDIVNTRFDNLDLILNKMFVLRRGSTVDYSSLFSAPGNVIEIDDLSDIREVNFTNTLRDSYQAENMIRSDMQMLSGMIDYGSTPEMLKGVGNTATGMSLLTSDAVSKYREPLDNVKESVINILKRVFVLIRKYANHIVMREVRSLDAFEKFKITDEDLKYDYAFTINLKNFLPDKQQTLQNLVTLLNIIGQVQGVNVVAYIKNIFDLMDEIKNPDEILPAMNTQIQEKVQDIREKQQQERDKKQGGVNAVVGELVTDMGGVPTPEEQLINPNGNGNGGGELPSPLNPQAKMPTETNTIQEILNGGQ